MLMLFQVLEVCWEELLSKVKEAKDLDHVIAAHETFVNQVMTRALMDVESKVSLKQSLYQLLIYLVSLRVNRPN